MDPRAKKRTLPPEKASRKSPRLATIDITSNKGSFNETDTAGAGESDPPVVNTAGAGESDPTVVKTQKGDGTAEDLLGLAGGDAVPRENFGVAYDSSGEAHRLAKKAAPTLTGALLKKVKQAIYGTPAATARAPQGGHVKGETNDLSVDLP